jgi:hypothetical protein
MVDCRAVAGRSGKSTNLRSATLLLRHDEASARAQVFGTGIRHRNGLTARRSKLTDKKAAVVGFLPDRKTRAGRSPGVEYLRIRAWIGAHPLEKVEDQVFDIVSHTPSKLPQGRRRRPTRTACESKGWPMPSSRFPDWPHSMTH